jgi:hypothetical protein
MVNKMSPSAARGGAIDDICAVDDIERLDGSRTC